MLIILQLLAIHIFNGNSTSSYFPGKAGLGDWSQVSDQRWQTKLEQSLHQDQGAENGQGDSLLLWKLCAWKNTQAEMRRVRIYIQERSLLDDKSNYCRGRRRSRSRWLYFLHVSSPLQTICMNNVKIHFQWTRERRDCKFVNMFEWFVKYLQKC